MLKKFLAAALALIVVFSFVDSSYGRGGRGGGGFGGGRSSGSSSRGSSGFGGGSKSSSAPKSSSSSSSSRGSGWFGGSSSTTNKSTTTKQNNMSATDTKLYQKAQQQGTVFKTRSEATTAFKQKHGSQYTSKYATEPATRPSHIPQTTTVGNKTYNVTYNQGMGGYGYWGGGGPGLGTFIMYDMFSDALMMNAMMSNHGYYHGAAPTVATTGGTTVVNSGWSPLGIFLTVASLAIVAIFIVGVCVNSGGC